MNDTVITVTGRIVNPPKRRVTESGVSVTSFRVASTARRRDRETQEWVDGDSLFLNVSCWRQLADNVARSLVQGDPIVVTGRIFTRDYEHEGQKRSSFDLDASAIGPDLSWGQVEFTRVRRGDAFVVNDPVPADEPAEQAGTDKPELRRAVA